MSKQIFGRTEADLYAWANNLARLVGADPGAYFIDPGVAAELVARTAEYTSAYQVASNLGTRSRVDVARRNDCRDRLLPVARMVAMAIKLDQRISDEQRVSLGLNVAKRPTNRPVPDGPPGLKIVDRISTHITVQLTHNLGGTGRRGKPRQADGAVLYWHVGAEAVTEASGWTYAGTFSRTRVTVALPAHLPPGTPVQLMGFWFNAHGNGPSSLPIHTVLAGGGMIMPTGVAA